jgi:hypothetical protein
MQPARRPTTRRQRLLFLRSTTSQSRRTLRARRAAGIELAVAFAVYLVGLALCRALRWIALGFLGQGDRSLGPSKD